MKRFKVMRLPLWLREELDRKLDQGGDTYAELLSFVRSRHPGADLSWSALYRYAKHYQVEQELYREARKTFEDWLRLGLEKNANL